MPGAVGDPRYPAGYDRADPSRAVGELGSLDLVGDARRDVGERGEAAVRVAGVVHEAGEEVRPRDGGGVVAHGSRGEPRRVAREGRGAAPGAVIEQEPVREGQEADLEEALTGDDGVDVGVDGALELTGEAGPGFPERGVEEVAERLEHGGSFLCVGIRRRAQQTQQRRITPPLFVVFEQSGCHRRCARCGAGLYV